MDVTFVFCCLPTNEMITIILKSLFQFLVDCRHSESKNRNKMHATSNQVQPPNFGTKVKRFNLFRNELLNGVYPHACAFIGFLSKIF